MHLNQPCKNEREVSSTFAQPCEVRCDATIRRRSDCGGIVAFGIWSCRKGDGAVSSHREGQHVCAAGGPCDLQPQADRGARSRLARFRELYAVGLSLRAWFGSLVGIWRASELRNGVLLRRQDSSCRRPGG